MGAQGRCGRAGSVREGFPGEGVFEQALKGKEKSPRQSADGRANQCDETVLTPAGFSKRKEARDRGIPDLTCCREEWILLFDFLLSKPLPSDPCTASASTWPPCGLQRGNNRKGTPFLAAQPKSWNPICGDGVICPSGNQTVSYAHL